MQWNNLADENTLKETIDNLTSKRFNVIVVENKAEALEKIKEIIPKNSEVMNGSSTTLNEIGFMDYLKSGQHGWNDIHSKIWAEKDEKKRAEIRRMGDHAEYFLASVNAISKTGALIAVDASGSRVGAFPFTAKKLVLVVGTNKIANSIEDGMKRVRDFVFPLENERAKKAYGFGSATNKWVILEGDFPGRTTVILVKEKLGY